MARMVGLNHIALAVGDVDEAVDFYGRIFDLTLRGRSGRMAFLDMGDQFLALSEGRGAPPDAARHFGLVVDDKDLVRATLADAGIEAFGGRRLNFRDPWGNQVQVVAYRDIMFTKSPAVLAGMGLAGLAKREGALAELRAGGLAEA
jgi:catechol 2,3-dioxygenase-like lactoylglutathione lyase family enzyme